MAEKRTERGVFYSLAEVLSHRFSDLKMKLKLAGIEKTPVEYMENAIANTIWISLTLIILIGLVMFFVTRTDMLWLIPIAIIVILVAFNYLMIYPDASLMRRKRELDYEIVFAGRHVLIALKSGMPLFDTFVGTSTGYGEVSREIKKIVDKIVVGVPSTQAIREVAQETPSKYFSRVMMQIANSLASGADVADSLEAVLDQISKEQMILLKEYSQKLTPMVMFYMLFGIIVPSIGVVLAVALMSVLTGETQFSSIVLLPVFLLIVLMQFLFLGVIESSRPKYLI